MASSLLLRRKPRAELGHDFTYRSTTNIFAYSPKLTLSIAINFHWNTVLQNE